MYDNNEAARVGNIHIFENVFNSTHSEFRSNVKLVLIRDIPFKATCNIYGKMTILPNNSSLWYAYVMYKSHISNILGRVETWTRLDSILNDKEIRLDLVDRHGRLLPSKCVYLKSDDDKVLIVVDYKMIHAMDIDRSLMYLYLGADSNVPNTVSVHSYAPGDHYNDVLTAYSSINDTSKMKVFVDGYYIPKSGALAALSSDKYISIYMDNNIAVSQEYRSIERLTYHSTTESLVKDLVAIADSDRLMSYDAVEIYIVNTTTEKGVWLTFNDNYSVSQLTNAILGITSTLIDNCLVYLGTSELNIDIYWMDYSKTDTLIRNGYEIVGLDVQDIDTQMKYLSNEYQPNITIWSGDYLEYHPYNLFMIDAPNDTTVATISDQIKCYGFFNYISIVAGQSGEYYPPGTSIVTMFIDKPGILTGNPMDVILYLNGLKIDKLAYSIADDDNTVSITFDPALTYVQGSVIQYRCIDEAIHRGYKFVPTAADSTLAIPFSERVPRIYMKVESSVQTPLGMVDHGYVEIDVGNTSLVMMITSAEWYTLIFNPVAFDKEIFIYRDVDGTYTSSLPIDITSDNALVYECGITDSLSSGNVPILHDIPIEVYMNGRYLIPDVDYKFIQYSDTTVSPVVVSEYFIVVSNIEYLQPSDNKLEVVYSSMKECQSEYGHIISNTIRPSMDNFLHTDTCTRLFVNGRLVKKDNYSYDSTERNIAVDDGTIYHLRTDVMMSVFRHFSPNIDPQYLNMLTELRTYQLSTYSFTEPDPIVVNNTHQIQSNYLSTIIGWILNDTISLIYTANDDDLLGQLLQFDYLKAGDVQIGSTHIDWRFVDCYPGYVANIATDDMEKYQLINRLIRIYLRSDEIHDGMVVYSHP